MTEQASLELRVVQLEAQVGRLTAEVTALRGATFLPAEQAEAGPAPAPGHGGDTEELLSMVGHSHILTRMASTSFILVVALALRELAKSGVIETQLGTLLGMVYAFVLIAYGWSSYSRGNHQAPVFSLWGTVVMCSVIVETHRVFESLPTIVAYLLLAGVGLATLLMSRQYRVALPVFVGTIGMSIGSFAINYPTPVFPLQAGIMALANIFAAYASGLLRASWLRWIMLGFTALSIEFWAFKLNSFYERNPGGTPDLSLQGLLPALAVLGLFLTAIALAGSLGKIQAKVAKFDRVLPLLNVLWIFATLRLIVAGGQAEAGPAGVAAILGGAAYLAVAWWLVRRTGSAAEGTTSFTLAGSVMVALALPLATGNALAGSALTAGTALALAIVSGRIGSGGMRLVSYLVQAYAGGTLIALLWTTEKTEPSMIGAVASGLLAVLAGCHYRWARQVLPPSGGLWTGKDGTRDRWAGILLVTTMLCAFFTLRMGLYQGLGAMGTLSEEAFMGGQSLMINLAAVALLLASLRVRDIEVRNVGLLITTVAIAKVLLDVVDLKGMALLVSIFSFGVAATVASLVLGRWNKGAAAGQPEG